MNTFRVSPMCLARCQMLGIKKRQVRQGLAFRSYARKSPHFVDCMGSAKQRHTGTQRAELRRAHQLVPRCVEELIGLRSGLWGKGMVGRDCMKFWVEGDVPWGTGRRRGWRGRQKPHVFQSGSSATLQPESSITLDLSQEAKKWSESSTELWFQEMETRNMHFNMIAIYIWQTLVYCLILFVL